MNTQTLIKINKIINRVQLAVGSDSLKDNCRHYYCYYNIIYSPSLIYSIDSILYKIYYDDFTNLGVGLRNYTFSNVTFRLHVHKHCPLRFDSNESRDRIL